MDEKEDLLIEEDNKEKLKIAKKLTPAAEFQLAYDLIRSRQYDKAKSSLKKFIDWNPTKGLDVVLKFLDLLLSKQESRIKLFAISI